MLKDSLTPQEMSVLGEILKEYLTDLRSEILDEDDVEEKITLKHTEEILKDILAKLEKSRMATYN